MSKLIKQAIEYQRCGGQEHYEGIDFLRDAVRWFNGRSENFNSRKSVNELLIDYAKCQIKVAKMESED